MNKTGIEYLTHTWNPIAMRCTPVSPGCAHCWHLKTADRMSQNPKLEQQAREAHAGDTGPVLIEERLDEPAKLKKPAVIGVQFMGDLFHEGIPVGLIEPIFRVMQECQQHTFLLLTKRPERMAFAWESVCQTWNGGYPTTPLSNVWLGVTAENQEQADKRIPILLQIPAAVHFVSVEPMLGEMNLLKYLDSDRCQACGHHAEAHQCLSQAGDNGCCICDCISMWWPERGIDWVICGAETGPAKRKMDLDWARSLRDQCVSANVPFFMKKVSEGEIPLDLMIREFPNGT